MEHTCQTSDESNEFVVNIIANILLGWLVGNNFKEFSKSFTNPPPAICNIAVVNNKCTAQ